MSGLWDPLPVDTIPRRGDDAFSTYPNLFSITAFSAARARTLRILVRRHVPTLSFAPVLCRLGPVLTTEPLAAAFTPGTIPRSFSFTMAVVTFFTHKVSLGGRRLVAHATSGRGQTLPGFPFEGTGPFCWAHRRADADTR